MDPLLYVLYTVLLFVVLQDSKSVPLQLHTEKRVRTITVVDDALVLESSVEEMQQTSNSAVAKRQDQPGQIWSVGSATLSLRGAECGPRAEERSRSGRTYGKSGWTTLRDAYWRQRGTHRQHIHQNGWRQHQHPHSHISGPCRGPQMGAHSKMQSHNSRKIQPPKISGWN